jgi:hypothetical protein
MGIFTAKIFQTKPYHDRVYGHKGYCLDSGACELPEPFVECPDQQAKVLNGLDKGSRPGLTPQALTASHALAYSRRKPLDGIFPPLAGGPAAIDARKPRV